MNICTAVENCPSQDLLQVAEELFATALTGLTFPTAGVTAEVGELQVRAAGDVPNGTFPKRRHLR